MQTIPIATYSELKASYPKSILFFRIGEVYQAIQEDALIVSQVLAIHLNKQRDETGGSIQFVVFPDYALDTYLPELVRFGFQVAVCDELEIPKQTGIQPTLFNNFISHLKRFL